MDRFSCVYVHCFSVAGLVGSDAYVLEEGFFALGSFKKA